MFQNGLVFSPVILLAACAAFPSLSLTCPTVRHLHTENSHSTGHLTSVPFHLSGSPSSIFRHEVNLQQSRIRRSSSPALALGFVCRTPDLRETLAPTANVLGCFSLSIELVVRACASDNTCYSPLEGYL